MEESALCVKMSIVGRSCGILFLKLPILGSKNITLSPKNKSVFSKYFLLSDTSPGPTPGLIHP